MYPSIGSSRSKRARGPCRENFQRSQARNESHQSAYGKTKVMNLPRRRFLGSCLLVFGSTLMDALTTPLWRWRRSLALQSTAGSNQPSPVQFVDVAHEAGLNVPNVWGATDHKSYIIEAKGSGIAFFDYDNDGWLDLFCCFWGHNILFHNNGDGSFTDITRKAGVYDDRIRWGAGCTFLDYDRDGNLDLFVCNYIRLDPAQA